MNPTNIDSVATQIDKIIAESDSFLNLSANETSMSRTAQKYLSSSFANRYYFESNSKDHYSDFPEFVATGSAEFDKLAEQARQDLMEMFGAEYANLNPLSGIHAMLMVMLTLTESEDVVASLSPQSHGHFATVNVINRIGRRSVFLPVLNGELDINAIPEFVKQTGAKMIYLDAMSYQQPFNIQAIRDAAGSQVTIVFDASHTLGLIAGRAFPNPFEAGADVICGNTHKTFPGPHRGLILAKRQATGNQITSLGSNLYSSVQASSLLAMIVTVSEMKVFAKAYAHDIVHNAQILQKALTELKLIKPGSPLTQNHQVHIHMPDRESAVNLMKTLKSQRLLSHVCYGDIEGFYIRLGTQEITRRGMGEQEMKIIAKLIADIVDGNNRQDDIAKLNQSFTEIHYSFDKKG